MTAEEFFRAEHFYPRETEDQMMNEIQTVLGQETAERTKRWLMERYYHGTIDGYPADSIEGFDAVAEIWPFLYGWLAPHDNALVTLVAIILERSNQRSAAIRVVDAGCGPGLVTCYLAYRFPDNQFIGYDAGPQLIQSARACSVRHGLKNCTFTVNTHEQMTTNGKVASTVLIANRAFFTGDLPCCPENEAEMIAVGWSLEVFIRDLRVAQKLLTPSGYLVHGLGLNAYGMNAYKQALVKADFNHRETHFLEGNFDDDLHAHEDDSVGPAIVISHLP